MFDCSKDILAFHNEKVTLIQVQRTEMRDRRNANRDRLLTRLSANVKPTPREFIKQGSYAMKTMMQDSENDYDIDDGVYFTRESLKDSDNNDMKPLDAKQMVCDALKDNRFKKQPEVKRSCVRIFYDVGYHVDMPVYRVVDTLFGESYELANEDGWVESRAADVEEWFYKENLDKSPDETNGRQFRRIVRVLKKFARSRNAWKTKIATGFTITKLVSECYVVNQAREDVSLRDTMKQIYNRLIFNLEVNHPVTPGAKLTNGQNDETVIFLRDQLQDALNNLNVLDEANCSQKQALAAWDKVFDVTFFSDRCIDTEDLDDAAQNRSVLANLIATKQNPRAVDKLGGGRFA